MSTASDETTSRVGREPVAPRMVWDQVYWLHVVGVGAVHLAALSGPFFFSWSGLAIAFAGWILVGCFGVCIGYHRLLTHRGFVAPRWFVRTLAFLGSFSWQGSPVIWVAKHRLHHRYSDRLGDPHSPRDGFFWGHMGWVFFHSPNDIPVDVEDIKRDPFLVALDRFHALSNVVLAIVLYISGQLVGGLGASWAIWGVAVRVTFTLHATWCVNSVTHRFGYRNYAPRDDSRNSWWVALITFGEGWHNNHHADPRSAAHGHRWWEFDIAYGLICALEWLGVAKDVRRPRRRILERKEQS